MSEIIWYLPFSDWLISLSIILFRPMHAVAKGTPRYREENDSCQRGGELRSWDKKVKRLSKTKQKKTNHKPL